MLFNTDIGNQYLNYNKGLDSKFVDRLPEFGFSSIANILASIKLAKYMNLGPEDAIITLATDGADLYSTELKKTKKDFTGSYDMTACAEIYGQYVKGTTTDHMMEINQKDKERIFNLGYYTWVEQQGIDLKDFEARRKRSFWDMHLQKTLDLDNKIVQFNTAS